MKKNMVRNSLLLIATTIIAAVASYSVCEATPDADFAARCSAPGVVLCKGLDTESELMTGEIVNASDETRQGFIDTDIKSSGAGSLRFKLRAGVNSTNIGGAWSTALGQTFNVGDTIYVQWRQRISPEYITNNANYWHSTIKQINIHGPSSTCQGAEFTTVQYDGYPSIYTNCGFGFNTDVDTNALLTSCPDDCLIQQGSSLIPSPNGDGYNCHYQNQVPGIGDGSGCFYTPSNTWVTYYEKIQIGTFGGSDSALDAYVAVNGGPYKQFQRVSGIPFNDNFDDNFQYIRLETYMSELQTAAPVDAYQWFDELIVSTQPIAAPGESSGEDPGESSGAVDNYSLPNIHVADCFDGVNVILAPGSICHDASGMWKCKDSPAGGTLTTLCDDETDYIRPIGLSDIETESGENIVTTGEFGLGVLFPTGQREVYDACSEAEAVILGCDTGVDNSADIGIKVFGSVTEGPVLKSIQTNVDTTFGLNDNQAFRIKDATTPTANDLFIVPEDGSSPSPAASTTKRGFVELATDGETNADVVVQGNDARLAAASTTNRGTATLSGDAERTANEVVTATDSRIAYQLFLAFRQQEATGTNDDNFFGRVEGGTPGGNDSLSSTAVYVVPNAYTRARLCCIAESVIAATTNECVLRVAGANTTVIIDDITTSIQCNTGTVAVAAGDRISVAHNESGTGGDAGVFYCTVELGF